MATKANPGKYDCYANAKDHEPMMVLLARGTSSPMLTDMWAAIKAGDLNAMAVVYAEMTTLAVENQANAHLHEEKIMEAQKCARDMRKWKDANPDV